MEANAGEAPRGVRRLVYRQLLPGDYRKLLAESNDSPTGGGARDLRFPFAPFDDLWARLLPQTRSESRRRKHQRTDVVVRYGLVQLDAAEDSGQLLPSSTEEMVWEPPTSVRPAEGRIVKVHAGRATAELLDARDPAKGEAFALFVQDEHGELRIHYAFEHELRSGEWASVVAVPILKHLDGNRRRDRAVQGYIDFVRDLWYAHDLQ